MFRRRARVRFQRVRDSLELSARAAGVDWSAFESQWLDRHDHSELGEHVSAWASRQRELLRSLRETTAELRRLGDDV